MRLHRPLSRAALLPTVLAAALLTAGCGPFGSSAASSSTPSSHGAALSTTPAAAATTHALPVLESKAGEPLAKAAVKVEAAGSAKVDATIVTQPAGTSTKVTVHLTGKERWSPSQAGSFALTGVQVGDATIGSATMLVTAKAVYLKLPSLASVLHKTWAKISFTGASSFGGVDLGQYASQAQQLQPGSYLRLLAQSANVKAVGTATIDGVATKHYAGSVDLHKAIAALPDVPPLWATLATAQGLKAAHVNAWLDAQGKPRKLTLALASSTLTTTITLHLSSYGLKVSVTAPPAAQTVDLTKGLLGALP